MIPNEFWLHLEIPISKCIIGKNIIVIFIIIIIVFLFIEILSLLLLAIIINRVSGHATLPR